MEIKRISIEKVQHNLECRCLRRREIVEIDGEPFTMEYTVESHDAPPTSDELLIAFYEATQKQRK